MVEYQEQQLYLINTLGLSTPPVAVKYFLDYDEDLEWDLAEKGFFRPKTPLNTCQIIALARYHLRKTIIVPEDHVCNIGAFAVGALPFDENMHNGLIAKKDGARATDALCEDMFQTLPRIQYGSVKAVAASPLDKMNLDADQVVIYGNPLQILKAVNGYLYSSAPRFELSTSAKYGICIEGLASANISGKPALGFPCRGERVSAIVQDSEIYLVFPAVFLNSIIEGIQKTKHLIPSPIPFSGVDQEPNFLPDYYLTPDTLKRRERKQ